MPESADGGYPDPHRRGDGVWIAACAGMTFQKRQQTSQSLAVVRFSHLTRQADCALRWQGGTMAQKSQDNFYDGWLYHLLVDPVLRRLRRLVRDQIKPGSSLIDIGCGTGELLFSLADRCSELVGVETSSRMWSYAKRRAQNQSHYNLRFVLGDGSDLRDFPTDYFDYATACMVLHEMGASQRLPVLREMHRLARNLVLVDYRVPPPANLAVFICRVIERLAGRYHYRNYLSFAADGGLSTLLETLDLGVHLEVPFHNRCLHLVKI